MAGSSARWCFGVLALVCAQACGGRALSESDGPTSTPGGASSGSGGASSLGGGGAAAAGSPSNVGTSPIEPSTSETTARACVAELRDPTLTVDCSLDCRVDSGCCSAGALCSGPGVGLPSHGTSCGTERDTSCNADAPSASISGTTPLGALTLDYAWKIEDLAFSGQTTFFFTDSANAKVCGGTSLGFTVPRGPSELFAPALLDQDGMQIFALVHVQLSAEDSTQSVTGTLDLAEDGFDLHGAFTAPYCYDLDSPGP